MPRHVKQSAEKERHCDADVKTITIRHRLRFDGKMRKLVFGETPRALGNVVLGVLVLRAGVQFVIRGDHRALV